MNQVHEIFSNPFREDSGSCFFINISTITIDVLFLITLFCFFIYKSVSRKVMEITISPSKYRPFSPLIVSSLLFNGVLGLAYLGFGAWMGFKSSKRTVLALLVMFLQGLTWLLLSFTVSLHKLSHDHIRIEKLCSVLAFLFSSFLFSSSLWGTVVYEVVSPDTILGFLSLPGAILLVLSAFRGPQPDERDQAFYEPLQEEAGDVTPFSRAGFLSKSTFWWLNPVMKEGKSKVLELSDVPKLRQEDKAKTCYMMFLERLGKKKQDPPSVLSVIVSCQWKPIVITGFFALIPLLCVHG